MHPTSYDNALLFYETFIRPQLDTNLPMLRVVEFGSCDINGNLRGIFQHCHYIGLDMSAGPNVDIVCSGETTPFEPGSVDVIISSSNFEHDDCFWMTFLEMCRIVKVGGLIYINAPSAGKYHGFPVDCWRFMADSGKALVKWADRHEYNMEIVDTYTDQRNVWNDTVCVYKKQVYVKPTDVGHVQTATHPFSYINDNAFALSRATTMSDALASDKQPMHASPEGHDVN